MITTKLAKFAAVAALSTGMVLAGSADSRAGNENLLLGGLLGGAAGAGAGFAFGKDKGAAIGGIMGLALGAMLTSHFGADRGRSAEPDYAGYAPPPPVYQQPVYEQPTYSYQYGPQDPYAPAYQGAAYQNWPAYAQAAPGESVCRAFTSNIHADGKRRHAQSIACLQADGTWRIVD